MVTLSDEGCFESHFFFNVFGVERMLYKPLSILTLRQLPGQCLTVPLGTFPPENRPEQINSKQRNRNSRTPPLPHSSTDSTPLPTVSRAQGCSSVLDSEVWEQSC